MGRRPIISVVVTVVVVVLVGYVIMSSFFGPRIADEGIGSVVSVSAGFAVIEVDGKEVEMTSGVLDLNAGDGVEYDSDEPGVFGLFRHYHVIAVMPE